MLDGVNPVHGEVSGLQDGGGRRGFEMVRNERTAGYMPSWKRVPKGFEVGHSFTDSQDAGRAASKYELTEQREGAEAEPFGFFDLLDMINPLQHIPILGTLYREITGDEIRPISRIIGGGLFGGPMGAASGLVTAVVEDSTGKEPIGLALSLIDGGGEKPASADFAKATDRYERTKREALRIERTVTFNS